MSLLLQIALGVLVAGGIGFGVWNHHHRLEEAQIAPTTINDETQASADVNLTAGTANADLDADMTTIDGQLKLVNDDSAEIDQSMNDKPISQ